MAMGSEILNIDDNTIQMDTLKNLLSFTPLYLEDIDTLIFQPKNTAPAISIDCDGELFLRIDPKTKEIVGIEIEDFEGYFITKYPAIAPAWKEMKGAIKKHKCKNENLTAFLTIVSVLLSTLIKESDCTTIKVVAPTEQQALLII
ncbi:MAG: hypothetical protein WC370_10435 [Dehalococcoidales bacterium]|jgi:hypothetical protein